MSVEDGEIELKTRGELDIIDITSYVSDSVHKSRMKDGIICIFVPGSTGAITTIEYEPGLLEDLPRALERIIPRELHYEHQKIWMDGNGHSHIRASMLGPSLVVPFKDGELELGTWQQIIFIELDIRARNRKIILKMIGE